MKPKLVIIISGPTLSKPGVFYKILSEGFSGHIITTSGNPDISRIKKVDDFSWHCFAFKKSHALLSRLNFVLRSLLLCLKMRSSQAKIDLVVTSDPLMTGLIGWACARILNAKFAPEVNGVYSSPAIFTDEVNNFLTILKRRMYPLIESFVLRHSEGIKLLFPEQLASLKENFQDKVVHSFPCHVDIGPFLNFKQGEEKKEILFAGFPFKLKGVDVLVAAFKLISERHTDWTLKILGWFPNQEELHKAIGGHPRIEVHPPVYYSEMPQHICTCGIFVLPSRTEAMGRVLVEAMAAGKPRIGSNIEGIPTVITDGIDGLLFKSEDIVDLSHKIELLITDPELRRKMGQAGRDRAQRDFNSRVYFNNLINFYNEIIKTPKKPNLLIVTPGPALSKPGEYYIMLSEKFAGHVITTSGNPGILSSKKVGDFCWHCFPFNFKHDSLSKINLVIKSLLLCINMRIHRNKIDLVVTYDPLTTGIIGMLCSFILKAKFAPQVNGVYTSPAEYLDNEASFSTKVKKFLYPKIEKLVLSHAHGIKLLFPTQIDPFNEFLSGKIIRWFPNNVNIQPFLATCSPNENNEILFTGFPFKRKGVDILIAAFKSIADKYPLWKLKILGWFSNQAQLNKAIDGNPQIFHHKPVMPSEMPFHIGQCSIFVLPSRSEAMGRVLLEAMAAGKPRIGANVDGIPTVIDDGIDGLLFRSEDVHDLAVKLELLISSPELRKQMGSAGRERAIREFNSTVYFKNLFDFYSELLTK